MRRGGKFKTKISIFYGAVIKFRSDTEYKYGKFSAKFYA